MELFEHHFNTFDGNLIYDEKTGKYEMFGNGGVHKHINYLTFKELFKNMISIKDPIILETGIASAGTNSTYLFNEYVRKYGGRFLSVDNNPELVARHLGNMCPATTLICEDSVEFLKDWVEENPGVQADVVYLDSYDMDWYNPHPSAEHGLKEFIALKPSFKTGTLLLIDDTPNNPYWFDFRDNALYNDMVKYYETHNFLPGKGQYVLDVNKEANVLLHNYQVLYKF